MSKKDGVVYTPADVVGRMLDMAGYFPDKHPEILNMDFMDNSCGDGNILVVAAQRMCDALAVSAGNRGLDERSTYNYFQDRLVSHIHGMELSADECAKCKERLDKLVGIYLGRPVEFPWDIRCCDSLNYGDSRKFDFVVCNPPYIRVHDWESDLTGYEFVEQGMKDMYLAFYELGLRELKPSGTMVYITPSSWFTSTAGRKMREYIMEHKCLRSIYDYGHKQVFENATTYVAITVMNFWRNGYIQYGCEDFGWRSIMIPDDSFCIDGKFYFGDRMSMRLIEKVKSHRGGNIRVKNGYATLADDVFILGDTPWNPSDDYAVPVLKASSGKWDWCVFPYGHDGKVVSEDELKEKAGFEYQLLCENRERLEARSTTEPWYAFGRTQAIKDTFKDKWAIKSIVKTVEDTVPMYVPAGSGVYGGLYILCDDPEQLNCLETEEFLDYVKSLKKYKSGGYYTFSSKDLEQYLNWKNAPGTE